MNFSKTPRNRLNYLIFTLLIIALGLFSRSRFIPEFIYPYLGDVLYTFMFFFIFGFLFPKWSSMKIAILSILTCYCIELTQLIQADWMLQLRSYRLGGLILGHGFLWSDIVSYTIGGLLGYFIEKIWYQKYSSI